MKTVFLGGTCNGSAWRDILLLALNASVVSAYNPVVPDWTPECQAEEIRQREISDYCLYVITPKMTGSYSIAEVVEDSVKRPEKTLFHILETDEDAIFSTAQTKSLNQVGKMVEASGGRWFRTDADLVHFLNNPTVDTPAVSGFESQGIDFGHAVAAAKAGKRVAREGWNGKGMFVFMRPGDTLTNDFLPKVKSLPDSVKDFLAARTGYDGVVFTPYFCMYAADGSIVNGWLPSQTDMLASDWVVLD